MVNEQDHKSGQPWGQIWELIAWEVDENTNHFFGSFNKTYQPLHFPVTQG